MKLLGQIHRKTDKVIHPAKGLEQELAAIREIAHIVSSSLNLEDTFDRFAKAVEELVPFDRMTFLFIDEEEYTWRVAHGAGPTLPFEWNKPYPLKDSALELVFQMGKTFVSNDMSLDSRSWTFKAFLEVGLHSIVMTPIKIKERVHGAMSVKSRERNAYGEREIQLLESLIAQIAPAIENTELYRQTLEAKEAERLRRMEIQTLYDVTRILNREGKLEDNLQAVLEILVSTVEANVAAVRVPNEEEGGLIVLAAAGPLAKRPAVLQTIPFGNNLTSTTYREAKSIIVNDYPSHPMAMREFIDAGLKSVFFIPCKTQQGVLATISIDSGKKDHFTPERVSLLATISDEIRVLLENAQLHQRIVDELNQRRRREQALEQAIGRLVLEENPDRTLQHIMHMAREMAGASYSAFAAWSPQGELIKWSTSGFPSDHDQGVKPLHQTAPFIQAVLKAGKALRCPDLAELMGTYRAPPSHPSSGSFIGVPVNIPHRFSGVFYLMGKREKGEFTEEDERLLNVAAVLAAVLLENSSLYSETKYEQSTLAAIQSSMAEGLVVVSEEGNIAYINKTAEAFIGLDSDKEVGRPAVDVLWEKARDIDNIGAVQALSQVLTGRRKPPARIEATILRPTRQTVKIEVFPIEGRRGGHMIGMLISDITQERELEERRNLLISVASHELRTPLTTILGYAELLLGENTHSSATRNRLNRIYNDALGLTMIINDLLDVSRIQGATIELNLANVSLATLTQEAIATIAPTSTIHEFQLDIPLDLPDVRADPAKLNQVLNNLLSNAVKYSPDGGTVSVSASYDPQKERAILSIADRGIGIAPGDIEKIFETFYRVKGTKTEGIRGTGLGLYIVKELLNLMGGEVWVESEVNEGSTFFISLPIG